MRINKQNRLRKVGINFMLLLLIGLFTSCEERFYPELDDKYQEVLVVDGLISSDPGPYSVKLSISSLVGDATYKPISGFEVTIEDNLGNSERLSEQETGTYSTAINGIQGIPGRSYRLQLKSPAEKVYFSEFEKMENPIAIDSVYPELEYLPIENYPYDLPGYRFNIDVINAQNDSTYFLWNLVETYQYESDFKIYFSYDGILHPIYNTDTLKTCWKTDNVPELFLISTASLSEPKILHFPLHYVRNDNRKLSVRYSLMTRQYCISKNAYKYWYSIKELNTDGDKLFTKQPYQIHGNMYNPDNTAEPVFGYFMAAGISEKRIFVNRPQAPIKLYYPECELSQTDYELYGWMFLGPPPPPENPDFVTQDGAGRRALPSPPCVNCLLKGGKLEKPDFWIDN